MRSRWVSFRRTFRRWRRATGLEAYAILQPAQAVGGDLYEVLRTPDGNLVLVIGDVSGKGIPAALFMAVTMTLVRALAAESQRPRRFCAG